MRRLWLTALCVVTSLPLAVHAGEYTGYVKLDGRYYAAGEGDWEYYLDILALVITNTSMTNCHRAGGGPITTGPMVMYYGPGVTAMQIQLPVSFTVDDPYRVAEITTSYGDVVCGGEVDEPPPPEQPDPDPLFRIFKEGFEGEDVP